MVNEQGKNLAIACRYVPYDQWFITHIDPTWKIKHLKQRIISKCLNLPFDPRLIQKDVTPNARPPSPITFAPDARLKPDIPIELDVHGIDTGDGGEDQESMGVGVGDEGYEEDDEWEQDVEIGGLYGGKISPSTFKGKYKVPSSPTTASTSFHVRLQQQQQQKQKQEQEPQITTQTYTLLRFSTGQVLEEEFQIAWYDIQSHELVELHSSFSPSTFASSKVSPMSIPSKLHGVVTSSTQRKKKSSSTTTMDQEDPPIPTVTALPRHIPTLYIQPYWQGWVRALRVVWRAPIVPETHERLRTSVEDSDRYSKGGGEGSEEGGDRKSRRHGERVEWRERWVVVHEGVINICRNPADVNPTRLPLSSLLALRGPEYLPHSNKTRGETHSSEPSTMTAGTLRTRIHSHTGPSTTSEDISKQIGHTQETVENDSKRNPKKPEKDEKQQLFSATSSPSLRTSPGQSRQPHRMSSYTSTTTSNSTLKSQLSLTAEDRERERLKALERRKNIEKVQRDVEALKKWDDLTFSFNLGGKDRDKSKSKGKEREKEEREKADRRGELRRVLQAPHQSTSQQQQYKETGDKDKFRSKSLRDNRTFIPASREEAEQAGMKVVCIKFCVQSAATREGDKVVVEEGGFPKTRRYTSTGPSLALVAASAPGAGGVKDFHGRHQPQPQPQPISLEEGYVASIADPSDMAAPTSPVTTRPTVVIPNVPPAATTATISPESQPESVNQAHDNAHSDSSSSISVSSPVFAHSPNESDLEDETAAGMDGAGGTNKPRKGYRFGGYHVQVQMKKVKSEGEDEQLAGVHGHGVGKGVEMEMEAEVDVKSKLGDDHQPQQVRQEEKEQERKEEEREGWVALDMINDNAFNSLLRILHRHSPSLSSSFTPSHPLIGPPILPQPNISSKPKLNPADDLHHGSKDRISPSDTEDDRWYAATTKNPATCNKAIHPPILESLAARTAANYATQRPLYVALPYPEWRLELVNRARRAGMKEIGRPLDLALHGWGREFEEMAAAARERKLEREREREMEMEMEKEKKKKRMSAQSHVSTIKERERRVSRVIGGSDADDDDDGDGEEEEEAVDRNQLDSDSEEESDTEWLAWMTDLPRQFHVQQSQSAAQTPQTSASIFTNPFSSSSLVDDDVDGPVRPPRTQEEERLLHADKLRKLEPSAISIVTPSSYLPSPTSTSFMDSSKLPILSSHSSFESLNHQGGSSGRNSTSFAGSSTDDLVGKKGSHSRSQSRSLQYLGSHRHVGSVPEESGDGYSPVPSSSSSKQGLHHSASVGQHLSSRKNELDSHRQNQQDIERPILTSEQIKQIESEVFSSTPNSPLPSHWTFPPIPMPSPPPRPPSSRSHTPSHTPSASTSTARPSGFISTNVSGSVEVKAPSAISDLARWPSSLGNSLSSPSSPSASLATSPNSTSPPRSSVFGSLGRSPSLLSKVGGQEKERKGFLLKKRMSRDLGKEKEKEKDRDTGESSASPFASTSVPSPTHNPNLMSGHHLYHSASRISSARDLLRRVRSGSSLRGEEGTSVLTASTTSPAGSGVTSPEIEGKEVQKKKKGPIDRIVRGFDSSLAFAEGR